MNCMKYKITIILIVYTLLSSCSNSGQLTNTIQSIGQKNVSSIYIGSQEILVPTLPGFSKVNIQNKKTGQLFGKYLFPNPGEEELAIFESFNNPNKFIRLVTFKEFGKNNINANDFIQFKGFLTDAQRMLKGFANNSNVNEILAQLGKQSGFRVKDINLDNGRFIDTSNALGLSSSHKISIDGNPFVKVEIASAIILIKGTLLSIQVVNTSGDGNSKWTKDNAKRMAAQVIGLNNGNIKVAKLNSSVNNTPRLQYNTNSKRTYKLSECDIALEMYQRNAIKEDKKVLLDNVQCFSGDDHYFGDAVYKNGSLYPESVTSTEDIITSAIETSKTPLEQYQLGIKYAKGGDMKNAKYWIQKAYENNDAVVKEKAEGAWNKYELWQY